jgi:hypothetical protein
MSAQVSEVASKAAPVEADISGMATRLEAQAKAHESLTAELTKDNKYLQAQHNPALTKELEQKLTSAGFPSFAIGSSGDIVYNPTPASKEPANLAGTKLGAAIAKPSPAEFPAPPAPVAPVAPIAKVAVPAGPPGQSDFVNFADIVAGKANTNFNVNASGFASEFGAADASTLDRLGITNLSLQQQHLVATFAKPGDVSFGSNALNYGNTVAMNFSDPNGAVDLSNISGLKTNVWGVSADLTSLDIGATDPKTGLSDVKAQVQYGIIGATVDQKVSI